MLEFLRSRSHLEPELPPLQHGEKGNKNPCQHFTVKKPKLSRILPIYDSAAKPELVLDPVLFL